MNPYIYSITNLPGRISTQSRHVLSEPTDTIFISRTEKVITSVNELFTLNSHSVTSVVVKEPLRGCGHLFKYFPKSNLPVDNGIVFAGQQGGVWIRQYSNIGQVNLLWFMNTNKPRNNPNFDCGEAIESASRYLRAISSRGGTIFVPEGLYFTKGFKLLPRVNIEGAGNKSSYFQLMPGSNRTAMIDLTNCHELFISKITLFGNLIGKSIHGILIATNENATNSVENLRIFGCIIQKFSGDGINSPKSNKTFSYKVYDNRIQENAGWGISNGATDNEFSFNYIFSNKQGGIRNTGSNNRFHGGKILLNGSNNKFSGGIYDSSSRSIYSNIECQENFYHGIVLENSHNVTMTGMLSDMNNTARRPVSELGGKGEYNATSYGLLLKGKCSMNNLELQLTSATLMVTKQTQFSYRIENSVVDVNYLKIIESNQLQGDKNLTSDNIKLIQNSEVKAYTFECRANGSREIHIPHTLGSIPLDYSIKPENVNAAGVYYTVPTSKSIIINYLTPPKGDLKFRITLTR